MLMIYYDENIFNLYFLESFHKTKWQITMNKPLHYEGQDIHVMASVVMPWFKIALAKDGKMFIPCKEWWEHCTLFVLSVYVSLVDNDNDKHKYQHAEALWVLWPVYLCWRVSVLGLAQCHWMTAECISSHQ